MPQGEDAEFPGESEGREGFSHMRRSVSQDPPHCMQC